MSDLDTKIETLRGEITAERTAGRQLDEHAKIILLVIELYDHMMLSNDFIWKAIDECRRPLGIPTEGERCGGDDARPRIQPMPGQPLKNGKPPPAYPKR